MSDLQPSNMQDPLDELSEQLLECGAVLSQIIGRMVDADVDLSEQLGLPAAPIPEAAHSLLREVLADMRGNYSRRDIRVAAKIVGGATEAICENVFFYLGPELN